MKRWLCIPLIACAFPRVAAWGQSTVEARQLSTLSWTGKVDSAEHAARRLGPAYTRTLADIFVIRGRLDGADSLYHVVVTERRPGYWSAVAGIAEIAARRGNWAEASARATAVTSAYEASGTTWADEDAIAAGRAYVVLGARDPQAFHLALSAFDRVSAHDTTNRESRLRAGDLLQEKYNGPDAVVTYRQVLQLEPHDARALLGLARVAAFEGSGSATDDARAALRVDPILVPALVLLARQHLDAERFDSATADARLALSIDSTAAGAWSVLGALAWQRGDSAAYAALRTAASQAASGLAAFDADVADALSHQRRYAQAVAVASAAVQADSQSPRAWGVLAENQLRTGEMTAGRADLERAFSLDPYNLWHKNMLDLLDKLQTFKTVNTARFQLVAPAGEADYLALYVGPLLEMAYDTLAVRYNYRPPIPIRVEFYGRHADFSVRTVGLTGLGALGVSFGTLLVLDSPQARDPGELNYGSTSWHELAHTFTLGLSQHRVPRWISEGLSVLEERRAGHGWGMNVTPEFLAAYKGGALPTASNINEGLVRPKYATEIGFSYYEASLVVEMIEAEHGIAAIRDILKAFAAGDDLSGALQRVLGLSCAAFDQHFDQWLRLRFASALAVIDSSDGSGEVSGYYRDLVRGGIAMEASGRIDSARTLLTAALRLLPDDASEDGPAWALTQLERKAGNLRAAVTDVRSVTMHSETALVPTAVESELQLQLADTTAAADALSREQWIAPYNPALHQRLAELSEAARDWPRAVRERRAILALAPPDPLEAGYQLARVLARAGDKAGARREILRVLEGAPAFEKAQALLLELQDSHH